MELSQLAFQNLGFDQLHGRHCGKTNFDISKGRNNFHNWFLLFVGPTRGLQGFPAQSELSRRFELLWSHSAQPLEGLAKCFLVNDVSVVCSCCEMCCNYCFLRSLLFCCLGSCCCVRDLGLLPEENAVLLLHRDLYVLKFLSHLCHCLLHSCGFLILISCLVSRCCFLLCPSVSAATAVSQRSRTRLNTLTPVSFVSLVTQREPAGVVNRDTLP